MNEVVSHDGRTDTTRLSRRIFLGTGAAVGAGWAGYNAWLRSEGMWRASTFVGRADHYGPGLQSVLSHGLAELGWSRERVRNKTVVLKPNLVEPSRLGPHINTHPEFIWAVAEVFRSWDAAEVVVAEGQGHIRDTWVVLEQSGLEDVLDQSGLSFVDLNHDDVCQVQNFLGLMGEKKLFLPRTIDRADVIVSLPKLKTHHWVGVTLSMKNLFGVMPGICYGWPKNVLHHRGIGESILDITATVRPHLAIVDGIVGMEGDGPIMGSPRAAGLVIMGNNLPAVDATASRLMGIAPNRIGYLRMASGRLGPIRESHIEQRGEALAGCCQSFKLPPHRS